MTYIQQRLFSLGDPTYRSFMINLLPTCNPDFIIGVRTPALRALAKELSGTEEGRAFLSELPHAYFEENNLHAFLLEKIRDFDTAIAEIERFLPYVDNWATCDQMCPKVLGKHTDALLPHIRRYLSSGSEYTVRFGIELLMRFYLDDLFDPAYPEMVARTNDDAYYVHMMIAWYFATALAKQYDAVIPYIQEHRLSRKTHNKAIQKAVESFRITPEQKAYLRTLRIK